MGGSVPLPALDLRPMQPTDALGSFTRLMQLRQMANQQQLQQAQLQSQQQEQQIRQQSINDQQLIQGYLRNNSSATYGDAANALRDKLSTKGYSDAMDLDSRITQAHAAATDAQLKVTNAVHDEQQKIYSNVRNLSDDELAKQTPQIASEWNAIPGNHIPLDPNQPITQQQLQQLGIRRGLEEAYLKQEQDKRETAAKTAESAGKGEEAQATAEEKRQQSAFYKQSGIGAPGVPPETVQMVDWLRQNPGKTPADYPAAKAGAIAQTEAPTKIATAEAEGRARANIEHEFATKGQAALANVPTRLVAPAAADAQKADNEFAQAKSVSDRLNAVMDAAKRGNVVSYQLIPQEGALQLTTSQGVHRINMAEIQNYGGGSLWQRMEGHIGKQLTGESIPASVLTDMAEMQKFMSQGAQEKYKNTLRGINQRYGSTFEPVAMEDLTGATQPGAAKGGAFSWDNMPKHQ